MLVLVVRLVCALVFHFFAMNDVTSASAHIKYIAMHPDHFDINILWPAFFMFVRAATAIFLEITTVFILMAQPNAYECIANFMALTTILSFDDLLFNVLIKSSKQ